jgi:hypothetical protein
VVLAARSDLLFQFLRGVSNDALIISHQIDNVENCDSSIAAHVNFYLSSSKRHCDLIGFLLGNLEESEQQRRNDGWKAGLQISDAVIYVAGSEEAPRGLRNTLDSLGVERRQLVTVELLGQNGGGREQLLTTRSEQEGVVKSSLFEISPVTIELVVHNALRQVDLTWSTNGKEGPWDGF